MALPDITRAAKLQFDAEAVYNFLNLEVADLDSSSVSASTRR